MLIAVGRLVFLLQHYTSWQFTGQETVAVNGERLDKRFIIETIIIKIRRSISRISLS